MSDLEFPIIRPKIYDVTDRYGYRFVPLDENGEPLENSRYTLVRDTRLRIGDEIELSVLGSRIWTVVQLTDKRGRMIDVRGGTTDICQCGTVFCAPTAAQSGRSG